MTVQTLEDIRELAQQLRVDSVRQHHLRPLLPGRAASVGLGVRTGLARDLRHRGGLRRHHLTLRPGPQDPLHDLRQDLRPVQPQEDDLPEEGIAVFHTASLQAVPSEHLPAAHAWRGPLPGIAHDLRLDDAGDARPAWITLLTTEHCNLQTQRVATISESNGRASVFPGAVSAGLIALGFSSTRGASPAGHMIFQVLVLTPLVFPGLVAFVRCPEIAIDDREFVTRITRPRRTYDQLVPELAPLMSQAVADEGVAAMLSPRWQPFQKMLSVAGSVAVITSVVLGGDAGVIVYRVSRLLYAAIAAGVAAGALALGWATWYQWRHWCQASPPSSPTGTGVRPANHRVQPPGFCVL